MIDREGIKNILPHRDPFLLVDEIIECEVGKSATGVWHVSPDFYAFKGHFPGRPILPGVLITEALAQTGAVAILQDERYKGKLAVFGAIKDAKFRGMVLPGDDLYLHAELLKLSSLGGKANVEAKVNGKVVCQGEIMFAFAREA